MQSALKNIEQWPGIFLWNDNDSIFIPLKENIDNEEAEDNQEMESENQEAMKKIRANTESDPGPINELEVNTDGNPENEREDVLEENSEEEVKKKKTGEAFGKHGIEIDTELANKEAMGNMEMNKELLNEIQINTNKEPEDVEADQENLLKITKKSKKDDLIHVDEDFGGGEELNDRKNESGSNEDHDHQEMPDFMENEMMMNQKGRPKSADGGDERFLDENDEID